VPHLDAQVPPTSQPQPDLGQDQTPSTLSLQQYAPVGMQRPPKPLPDVSMQQNLPTPQPQVLPQPSGSPQPVQLG